MKQWKYVLMDIRSRKGILVIFLLEIMAIMLLFSNAINSMVVTQNKLEKVSSLRNSNAYIAVDNTSDEKMQQILNDEDCTVKLADFFNWLENDNIKYCSEFGYDISMNGEGIIESQKSVTKDFFNMFGISVSRGRVFSDSEYEHEASICPVVIGAELEKKYKLNEVYKFENGGLGTEFKGKVIGVLSKNSMYYNLNNINMPIYLDNSYIVPVNTNYNTEKFSFSDYDMALSHMVIFDNSTDKMEQISKALSALNLFDINFISADEQTQEILHNVADEMLMQFMLAIFILIFTLVCINISFHKMIIQNMYEYGIHMICGATVQDLIRRFFLFVYTIIGIALVLVIIITCDYITAIISVLFGLVLGIIVLIYPFVKLRKLAIIQIVNRGE